ncbi:tetratricopeptide repeat protein [Flavobacterium pallidum]|nr:tetratricopeptide repeat protein [Flavobacterium pallidum]
MAFSQGNDPDSVYHWYERDREKNPEKALQHILNGIKKAEKRKDKYHIAAYLVKLIEQKNFIRDYDGAYRDFKKAEKYCIDNKIDGQLPCAYSQYAETCYNMEDFAHAMQYFHLADSIFASQKDGIGVVISKNNIANIYQVQGKYDLAIKNLLDAARNVDTTQYRYIKVEIFNNISELYETIGENHKAQQMARSAMAIALGGKRDNPQGLLRSYAHLTSLLTDQGKYTEAEKYYNKGIHLADSTKLESLRFDILRPGIALKVIQDKMPEAKQMVTEAIALGKKYKKNTSEMYPIRASLARIYLFEGQPAKAISLLNELLNEGRQLDRRDDIAEIYNELSQAYEKTGDFKKALQNHKLFVVHKDSILGREKQKYFKDAQVKYETAIKEKQLAQNKIELLKKSSESKKKTNAIIMLAALVFFLAVLSYLIYRQQKLKAGQREKEFQLKAAISQIETQNKLQEQRLSISRDLHDNIGAQLTFIISSVDNVKFGFNLQNTKLNDKLDNISDFTKSTILELRDTIWAMNHAEISFEELRSRIFNFLEKAKTAKGSIAYTFHLDESINEMKLSSLQGINMYRTIQEAVNNAIKYAEATKIVIEAKSEKDRIVIQIRDNGIGFDTKATDRGNGLGNMKKRMKEIGAEFDIKSAKDAGTTVMISLQNKDDNA